MNDPGMCRHAQLEDHPEPPGGFRRKGSKVVYVEPYPKGSRVTYKVMRCVNCGLPGEVPT